MTFDPNDPFNPSSFHNHYDHHKSSFDRDDHFSHRTQHHNEIKASTDHYHYDSQRTCIDEDYARAAREQTMQLTRNLDTDAMSITERLRKFFCGN